jgi:hypothetical protein
MLSFKWSQIKNQIRRQAYQLENRPLADNGFFPNWLKEALIQGHFHKLPRAIPQADNNLLQLKYKQLELKNELSYWFFGSWLFCNNCNNC